MSTIPPTCTCPSLKEPILSLSDYHGRGEFHVVIHYGIDSSARGIAAHQPGIIGLQQFGHHGAPRCGGGEPIAKGEIFSEPKLLPGLQSK